ncbi:hypothetical protein ADUPG1_003543, partial [Aduncisulcus paluster]
PVEGVSHLEHGLDKAFNPTLLDKDNKYHVSEEHGKQRALMGMHIDPASLPPVMTISLMRYSMDMYGRVRKINDYVEIPRELDISEYCKVSDVSSEEEVATDEIMYLREKERRRIEKKKEKQNKKKRNSKGFGFFSMFSGWFSGGCNKDSEKKESVLPKQDTVTKELIKEKIIPPT